MFYDSLELDSLDVINIDQVTQVPSSVKSKSSSDDASSSSSSKKEKKSSNKTKLSATVIPLTMGRARVSSGDSKSGLKDDDDRLTGSLGAMMLTKLP
eukprot:11979872-Ditylum_brightwellii.AAC.1